MLNCLNFENVGCNQVSPKKGVSGSLIFANSIHSSKTRVFLSSSSLFVSFIQKYIELALNDAFKPLKRIYFMSDAFTCQIYKF